jgi:uncharacterized protein YgbK (DUF1537 family)
VILGVVADDFTGATDVAGMLSAAGMRTVLVLAGVDGPLPQADAVVVALKSRTAPVADAVAAALAAWSALAAAGAAHCYFKICSTFDSTPAGNIGPVAEALAAAVGARVTIVCPALPTNGRTVFRGHMFVGDELLSDSGMRHHPLTPMTDSNLVRVMQQQCTRAHVGLVRHDVVGAGAGAVRTRLDDLVAAGDAFAIADAVDDDALTVLAEVVADHRLVVAGSGVAQALPGAYERRGLLRPDRTATRLAPVDGRAAVVAGSCSMATQAQVASWRARGAPAFAVDARALLRGDDVVGAALDFAAAHLGRGPVLVHATVGPDELRAVQHDIGAARAGSAVEAALARIATGLIERGVRRLVVAGGETAGAVVGALGVHQLQVGPSICPGVPWTRAEDPAMWLALKSGNFGGPDFFADALALAEG